MASIMMINQDFELLAEIPHFVGLTLKRSYYDVGSFKLTMKRGMPNWDLLKRDALLYFPNQPDKMMLIEKVTITHDSVSADGTPLKGLAKRRIAVPSIAATDDPYKGFGYDRFTGDAESTYLHYAAANLANPEDSKRAVPRLTLAQNQHRGDTLPWQARFDKLHELFKSIGEGTGVGWDIRPDFAAKAFVFGAWVGVDRSKGAERAIISREVGTADDTTSTDDATTAISTVYAGGAGEDENRLILSVGNEAVGLERRESWTDISGATDTDMLKMGAQRKQVAVKQTLTASVRDSGLCRYERDYDVGDMVVIAADGKQTITRLIGMEEVHEGGRRKLKGTFGDEAATLSTIWQESGRKVAW